MPPQAKAFRGGFSACLIYSEGKMGLLDTSSAGQMEHMVHVSRLVGARPRRSARRPPRRSVAAALHRAWRARRDRRRKRSGAAAARVFWLPPLLPRRGAGGERVDGDACVSCMDYLAPRPGGVVWACSPSSSPPPSSFAVGPADLSRLPRSAHLSDQSASQNSSPWHCIWSGFLPHLGHGMSVWMCACILP